MNKNKNLKEAKYGGYIHCKSKRKYSEEYDSHYCPKCLYWLEIVCPSRDCMYCSKRPKYPKKNQK